MLATEPAPEPDEVGVADEDDAPEVTEPEPEDPEVQ